MLSQSFLLLLVCFAVCSYAQPVTEVIQNALDSSSVGEFFGKGPNYDDESLLMADSVAFGAGTYKGEEILDFFALEDREIERGATAEITSAIVDQAKNTAIVKMDISGVFKRTGKPFSTTLVQVFQIDPITRLVQFHLIIDSNAEETSEQYDSRASLLLKDLYWSMFESSTEDLKDINSPIWQKFSDDIIVKLHVDPKRIFPDDIGTEWQGKEEVLEGWKYVHTLHQDMKKAKAKRGGGSNKYEDINIKVLYEDEQNVWVGIMNNKKLHALIHYVFPIEEQGKLGLEEIWLAKPLYPWQVYPWPTKEPDATPFSSQPLTAEVDQKRRLLQNNNDDDPFFMFSP